MTQDLVDLTHYCLSAAVLVEPCTVHLSGNVCAWSAFFVCYVCHIPKAGGQNVLDINLIKIYIDNNDRLWASSSIDLKAFNTAEKRQLPVSVLPLFLCRCLSPALHRGPELCLHTDSGQQLRTEPTAEIMKQTLG